MCVCVCVSMYVCVEWDHPGYTHVFVLDMCVCVQQELILDLGDSAFLCVRVCVCVVWHADKGVPHDLYACVYVRLNKMHKYHSEHIVLSYVKFVYVHACVRERARTCACVRARAQEHLRADGGQTSLEDKLGEVAARVAVRVVRDELEVHVVRHLPMRVIKQWPRST